MSDFVGRLFADPTGVAQLCRHVDASPFAEPVSIPNNMSYLKTMMTEVPIVVERSARVSNKRRKRCHDEGFWSDIYYATSRWVNSGSDDLERASRAKWSMGAMDVIEDILPQRGVPLKRNVSFPIDGHNEDLINWYGLDFRPVWKCLYYFGLNLNNAATHVLAVWLQGGHAVDWEGTFPDGRIVGYFFGGSPSVPGDQS